MENAIEKDVNRCFVVYMHTSPNNKRYIGITRQNPPEKRWGTNGYRYKRNKHFYSAIKKYGWDNFLHEILFENLTKEDAEEKEIELIAKYNSTDKNYGYNILKGGNAPSEETIKRYRIAQQNMSAETKRKISMSKMGHEVSEEARRRLSEAHSVSVVKYSMDGVFIKKYNSFAEAANDNNLSMTAISNCCRNKTKSSGGFIWRYGNDTLTDSHLKWCNNKNTDRTSLRKMVTQYSKNGEFIKEYNSINIASLETDIKYSNISACCLGKLKTAGGYIWRYSDEELTKEYLRWCNYDLKQNNCVKVLQYSIDGNLIAEYNSILLAAESVGCRGCNIVSCCKGRTKSCHGYIWRYANDENNEFGQTI